MSLRVALERLPHDRESEVLLRNLLAVLRHHADEWLEPREIAPILHSTADSVGSILEVLSECFVLDFDDGPPRYVYRIDRMLEIEIDRFVRGSDSRSGMLQNNVERFRQRYGSR